MNQLTVELGERSYPVYFRAGAATELRDRIEGLGRRCVLVTDDTVNALHAQALEDTLRARGQAVAHIIMPAGEAEKTLATVERFYGECVRFGVDRRPPLVALGGGVVGDVAGFLAATLLRGLPWVQVPTTVLAQVDSSVGGKTAVNLPAGKNLVGAFHQPQWVFIDTAFIETLSPRDIAAGLSEAIKHGSLASPALLGDIESQAAALIRGDGEALRGVVGQAVAIKAQIVAEDERETGRRALLNFGHTLGHAIEAEVGYGNLRHGEAVALGMRFAARLSSKATNLPLGAVSTLDNALDACGLPGDWADYVSGPVLERVALDKKIDGKWVNAILLRALGDPQIVRMPLAEFQTRARKMAQENRTGEG